MYRGTSNPDYHRPPVPPSGFGLPGASFGPPPFCPPFGVPPGPRYCAPPPGAPPGRPYGAGNGNYRESFYESRPFTSHTADQSGSTLISSLLTSSNQNQLGHSSQNWSTQTLDEQNQEVRDKELKKKAEEFLRILEANDRIELPGDKNDNGDRTADKHPSQTRSRSRGRSRPRSRSRSRGRSQGRSRARSRGKSRARSRSRSRGKSRTRAKSRARSRSRSHRKSGTRSKSQSRLSPSQTKQASRGTAEGNHSSSSTSSGISLGSSAMPDLFHGLRQILQNKDLDKHLPLVKNALLRSQNTDDTRGMFLANQSAVRGFQNPDLKLEPETSAELYYGSMLPHERPGGDSGSFSNILSWNTPNQQPETKPAFQSVEDEEKFLYGEEEERSKPQAVTVPLAQTRSVRSPVHHLSKEHQTHSLQEPKAHASVPPAASGTTKVTPEECEKVRTLLRTIGLNPGMADICKMAARLKEKKEEQGAPASLPMLKPALEALQALSRATKTDDSRSNRSGSSHSNHESKREKKTDEKERDRREKQIQKKRKEYLVKELEGLMKQEGEGDLIPVMGFFCQRCEEFFGDLNSAERHVERHSRKDRNKTTGSQEHHRDAKRHEDQHHSSSHRRESPHSRSSRVYQDHRERSPDRKHTRDERSPHSTDIKLKNEPEGKDSKVESKDKYKEKKEKSDDDAESTKSEKKKKKKEKKMKKKEKKKKKDKKKAVKDSP